MRKSVAFLVLALAGLPLVSCTRESASEVTDTTLASETVETYPIRGIVRDRNRDTNSILFEHEAIPGYMGAMTMSFRVEGTEVAALPPPGTTMEGLLHVAGVDYWLSDLRPAPAAPESPTGAPGLVSTDTTDTAAGSAVD